MIDLLAAATKELRGFEVWIKATEQHFAAMEEGWTHADVSSNSSSVVSLLKDLSEAVRNNWNDVVRAKTAALTKVTPPKPMLCNARMLLETSLRDAFKKAVNKLHATKLVDEITDLLQLVKIAEDKTQLTLSAKSAATSARRAGKLAICVNWCLGEVVSFKPTCAEDLTKHGNSIMDKLKLKGFVGKERGWFRRGGFVI